jgi:hypothetical protein
MHPSQSMVCLVHLVTGGSCSVSISLPPLSQLLGDGNCLLRSGLPVEHVESESLTDSAGTACSELPAGVSQAMSGKLHEETTEIHG